MIKLILIENFQSHKETEIELDPGVNIISGSSDCGKTAIIRALNWLINNRPAGDSIRSTWGGDTRVSVVFVDESEIVRVRGDKENAYYVNGAVLKAFGKDIPDEVSNIHVIDEINFQYQLDQPFLLSLSPGETAKTLNRIADLTLIDKSHINIGRKISSLRSYIYNSEDRKKQLEIDLEKFVFLDSLEVKILSLEESENRSNEMSVRISGLKSACDSLKDIKGKSISLRKIVSCKPKMKVVEDLIEIINKDRQTSKRVSQIVSDINTIEIKMDKCRKIANCFLMTDKIVDIQKKVTLYTTLSKSLKSIVQLIDKLFDRQNGYLSTVETARERLDKIMPDICPVCEQPIKKAGLDYENHTVRGSSPKRRRTS